MSHEPTVGLYVRVLSDVLSKTAETNFTDIVETVKRRLAALRIPMVTERFHAAVNQLMPRFPLEAPKPPAELPEPARPLSQDEAVAALQLVMQRISAQLPLRTMPKAKPLSLRRVEAQKASKILAQGILEQVQRCEAAEEVVHADDSHVIEQ